MNIIKTCALVIGHTAAKPGAKNAATGVTEFRYNEALSMAIAERCNDVQIVRVYRETLRGLPDKINALKPDFIISMHCNAFNQTTSGTEVLYYPGSTIGSMLAEILQREFVRTLKLNNRGAKPCLPHHNGHYLLSRTRAPCVIAEPFFIDNNKDMARATLNRSQLVQAYCTAIQRFAKR